MFLPPEQTERAGTFAVETIKARLVVALGTAPYVAEFETWGGVLVCDNWADAQRNLASKRPMLILELGDVREDDAEVLLNARRLLIEVSVECVVGPFCAAADTILKDALVSIINASIPAFEEVALEETEIRAGQGRNEQPGRINPHTITMAAHTRTAIAL